MKKGNDRISAKKNHELIVKVAEEQIQLYGQTQSKKNILELVRLTLKIVHNVDYSTRTIYRVFNSEVMIA
mgnify:CR=1 FL=1